MPNTVHPPAHNYPFAYAGPHPTMDPKERFYRQFQLQVATVNDSISRLGSVASVGGERKDAIDSILTSISRLSHEVADAGDYIPAYDQRLYFDAIKALTDQLNEETTKTAPKSRFQFKRTARPAVTTPTGSDTAAAQAETQSKESDPRILRGLPMANDTTSPAPPSTASAVADNNDTNENSDAVGVLPSFPLAKNYNAELVSSGSASGPRGIRKPSFSTAREIAISGHTGLHIILPLSASRATASGSLTDLRDCVVDMSVPTTTTPSSSGHAFLSLVLKNMDRCLIVAGHVSGPVHITGLRDSIVVVASRQVRIHECHNVEMYLYCSSRPIIEDCHSMRFAPLPACYTMNRDEEAAINQWDQVDDFKWLKAGHSPNWSVLPEAKRLSETVWKGAVAGAPGLGTEDVLRAVGIKSV